MKFYKSYLILFVVLVFASCQKQIDSEEFVREVIHKYKEKNSMTYDMDYLWKSFDDDQAWYLETSVALQKVKDDSIFRGRFLYHRQDSLFDYSKYYSSKEFYVFEHLDKTIQSFQLDQKNLDSITENADFQSTKVYFLDLDNLEKKMFNTKVERNFTENSTHIVLKIFFPDEADYTEKEERIYFNKEDKTIDRITFQAKYRDRIQQNTWDIKNIEFDVLPKDYFEKQTQKYFDSYQKVE